MTSSPPVTMTTGDPHAEPGAIVEGPGFRITVLTSRLLRLERSEDNQFTDRPTQLVLSRRFPLTEFTATETEDSLELWTEHLHLRYDKQQFSAAGLAVTLRQRAQNCHHTTWRFGDAGDSSTGNLGGTTRTLDDVDGATPLEPGLLSTNGFAVVDDSRSLLRTPDGWLEPRPTAGTDLYFFGYGRDYAAALRDYFTLTGPSPLLPRWALGNWWSRYHRYTAEEYLALMDRFTGADIPFSVAVLDMDWHLVDIDPALGSGWTGYTWDTELFPDPAGFLRQLHDRGLRVSLNVHPADGVRSHEEAYPAMAEDLGLDPDSGREIAFDITSRAFVDAYFRHLHHPHEEIGVDFWWLDWQSGSHSRIPGLDPLWMLNELHYEDSARNGARPLTFSRYAGLGSHRYPIGFSGDTHITWESLAFQPYFTATAANVGYHWWSHDIGGHFHGSKDDQLATRWFQFGVFSPVNRLHSAASPFNSKEPWCFGPEAERIMARYLRLRHQLVPYLYTAMWASHTEGTAPVRPMYHAHPTAPEAYQVPNQYLFGAGLLVAPITSPVDPQTLHAEVTAWLPEGRWYDALDGRPYDGGRRIVLHRTLDDIPVLAPAGAIVPLAADPMADISSAPEELLVKVFAGADGEYTLVEDDGTPDSDPTLRQETRFSFIWPAHGEGTTADAELTVSVMPGGAARTRRRLVIELVGAGAAEALVTESGTERRIPLTVASGATSTTLDLGTVDLTEPLRIRIPDAYQLADQVRDRVFGVLDRAQIAYELKIEVMGVVDRLNGAALLAELAALQLPGNLLGILTELVAAAPTA